MAILNEHQKRYFHQILEELGRNLDISETEYNTAVSSYNAVGKQLSKDDSILAPYSPEILPQGSFLLGTMIKSINETDDLDIDLVCQLRGKNIDWTQEILKKKVGEQLCENKAYKKLIEKPDGRRCWTLRYREEADDGSKKYHMDILPSVVEHHYQLILERSFSAIGSTENLDELAIRITDRERYDYETEKNHHEWLKSNPFGYARWFYSISIIDDEKRHVLEGVIQEVPRYQKEKSPLQRVIQVLKRHRDMMFSKEEEKEDKPISIIITTLASKAYKENKSNNVLSALEHIVDNMKNYIEERYDKEQGRFIKWVVNPVNDDENFADKWVEHPKRQTIFYNWLDTVKTDISGITSKRGSSLIIEMKKHFGDKVVNKTFKKIGTNTKQMRANNQLKMAASTGILGTKGIPVKQHQFYGSNE